MATTGILLRNEPVAARAVVRSNVRRRLVYLLLFVVALVRLFTESLGVLPRVLSFADIPLFFYVCAALLFRYNRSGRGCEFFQASLSCPLKVFTVWTICSIAINMLLHDIRLLPAISFLFFHLEPIIFALFLVRLGWEQEDTRRLAKLLAAIGIVQIPISLLQLKMAFSEDNPDLASGTFGTNGSQMCFFLVIVIAYLLGRYLIESKVVWLLPIPPLTVVFYAQGFKAMWLPFALTITLAILVFYPGTRRRKCQVLTLLLASIVLVALPLGKITSSTTMQFMKAEYIADVLDSGIVWELGKIQSFLNVPRLYRDSPSAAFLGVGPGSFSSRAFQTFADASPDPDAPTNVTHGYVAQVAPGVFAEKYIIPLVFKSEVLFGSSTVDGPFNSYVSLLAEVGLVGFACYVVIYYRVFRRTAATIHEAWQQRNPELYALSLAGICGILTLAQMAFLDNWAEVSRVTIPLWLVLVPVLSSREASRI